MKQDNTRKQIKITDSKVRGSKGNNLNIQIMKTLKSQLEKFKKETGCMLDLKNKKPYNSGFLNLKDIAITSLPDNLTVGGSLHLEGTAITSLPDNLTVGGSLHLKGLAITSLPDNLVVGGSLHLKGSAITSLPDNFTVGGSLYLKGSAITSLPNNLKVGRSLYLKGSAITSLPNKLTIGESLHLNGTAITSLPDNLKIGRSLYLEDTVITDTSKVNYNIPNFFEWRNCEYIKVDGRFSKVVSHKGNVYKVCYIDMEGEGYIVTNGNGKWSHGFTLEEAKRNLTYKISNRNISRYESLTLDSELIFEEAVECYRVITGACSGGTYTFIEGHPDMKKDKYTIREIIKITEGQYNSSEFNRFFEK